MAPEARCGTAVENFSPSCPAARFPLLPCMDASGPAPPPRSVVSDSRCLHVTAHSRSAIVVAALADLPATIPSHPLEASTNLTCHVPTNHPLPLWGWMVWSLPSLGPGRRAPRGWYSTPWWLVRQQSKIMGPQCSVPVNRGRVMSDVTNGETRSYVCVSVHFFSYRSADANRILFLGPL